ncbi:MAG TPA: hypothetical protein PLN78_06940, partial [Pseudomonadales bacterium]|nr:hypothetical protein [Pseudomonadales bacterium]
MAGEADSRRQLLATADEEGGNGVGGIIQRERAQAHFANVEGTCSLLGECQRLARCHVETTIAVGKDELAIGGEAAGNREVTTAQANIGRTGKVRATRSQRGRAA